MTVNNSIKSSFPTFAEVPGFSALWLSGWSRGRWNSVTVPPHQTWRDWPKWWWWWWWWGDTDSWGAKMSRGRENRQEGKSLWQRSRSFFFFFFFPKRGKWEGVGDTGIKRWHLNRHVNLLSFCGYKSLLMVDLLPPLQQMCEASRSTQRCPSLLFCLVWVSEPLTIISDRHRHVFVYVIKKPLTASYFSNYRGNLQRRVRTDCEKGVCSVFG